MKIILTESQIKSLLKKKELDEDYPMSWDINVFKTLNSFRKRIEYCETHLQRISSGSSRIVYKIDDAKVLKLAKNKKGLAQNELEIEYSQYYDLHDILARTFDYAQDNTWVEMELARKLTIPIFKKITGFEWDDYIKAMGKNYLRVNPQKAPQWWKDVKDNEIEKEMWENEFIYSMFSLLGNYSMPVGDIVKTSSYGVVNRDGKDVVVLIDYGINDEVYESYYK